MSLEKITKRYNSDKKFQSDVKKAWYAYHAGHHSLHNDTHNFTTEQRTSDCLWCGRSREMVRWDILPAQCFSRPAYKSIQDIIKDEEESFHIIMNKAERMIPNLLTTKTLNGKLLADLHFTHGIYPEIVEFFIDKNIDKYVMDEYEIERKIHTRKSKTSFKLT